MHVPKKEMIAVPDEIPELQLPFAKIRVPHPGSPVHGIVVNPKPARVYTHYYNGRTIPHLQDKNQCEGCQAERGKRFKAYLSLYSFGTKELILAELTLLAVTPWKDILDDPGCNLRGQRVEVVRVGRANNSRMKLDIKKDALRLEGLPKPFDILEVLRQIWSGEVHVRRKTRPEPGSAEQIPV